MNFITKTFLIIILSLSMILSSTYNMFVFTTKADMEMSCCKKEKSHKKCCKNCSKDNICKKTCSSNCCYNFVVFVACEVYKNNLPVIDVHSKLINNFSDNYSYLFYDDIYKPPIS